MSKEAKALIEAVNEVVVKAGLDKTCGLPVKGEVPTIPGRIERVIDKALSAAYDDGFSFSKQAVDELQTKLERAEELAERREAGRSSMAARASSMAADIAARDEKIRTLADHRQRAEAIAAGVTERLRQFLVDAAKKLGVKAVNTGGDSFLLCNQLDKLLEAVGPNDSSDEVVELMNRLTATQQELAGVQRALDHAAQQRDAEREERGRLQSALADATAGQCSGCAGGDPAISMEAVIPENDVALVDALMHNTKHRIATTAHRKELLDRLADRADTIAALQPALLAATGELAGWKLIGETITTDNLPEVAHDVAVAFADTLLKGSKL